MGAQLSTLLSTLDSQPQIDALVSEAATMQQDIENAVTRCTSLEMLLATLQSESDVLLKHGAAPAMDALLALVNRIESLHHVTQDQRTSALMTYRDPTSAFGAIQARAPLVNACKLQSQVVFGHFQLLSEKARNLTQQFTEVCWTFLTTLRMIITRRHVFFSPGRLQLATDFTFQITLAQERIEKLQNMVQVAETLRNGVERQRESWQYVHCVLDPLWYHSERPSRSGQKATAEAHIQQARETIRSAERKRDSMESVRVRFLLCVLYSSDTKSVHQAVRNFLTFGLGEVFDFFDLNEEIEDAGRTVASAERNARSCEQSIQRAIVALQRINDEVARLNTLGDTARAQEPTLQASVIHGQALRTRTIDLTNASLDVSLFVGTLAAKSETFAIHHTAQEFARGVLSFGRLMVSEGKLNGLLMERNPGALQETLDLIAQSDGEISIAEDGRFIGTQQPQLAIEDMM